MSKEVQIEGTDYDLGLLAGEIIEIKYLPTLETDMIKTFNVVTVDADELIENKRLERILNETYIFNGGNGESKKEHKAWIDHVYILGAKHLPEKLKCRITNIKPKCMTSFKEGLTDYLWNTDLSWYMPGNDFFKSNIEHAWSSTIILTRVERT
jgi:hypothetical protein